MTSPNQPVIALECISKVYGNSTHALRDVALTVGAGEIFGLLGPNGAGKSTLVKVLLTVVRPTVARGLMLGRPIGDKKTLARIGYLPEQHRLAPYLTARQAVEFVAALSGVERAARKKRTAELLERVGLRNWMDKRVNVFSKGMRQRAGLAAALVNDPQIVFLDEPTDGVDPVGRVEIRDLLIQMRSEGRTVFLNSHLLGEAEQVCDRVAILVQGRVVKQGSLVDLQGEGSRQELTVRWVSSDAKPLPFRGMTIAPAPTGNGTHQYVFGDLDAAAVQPALDAVRVAGGEIVALVPMRQGLEELFMKVVVDPATGRAPPPGAGS
ncbi:MAG: ABC transporter ATP-binding protein [Planctomycetes bacterium]|nr:ABC transporter ATP-binding protein [Planctomycetota bacterium]